MKSDLDPLMEWTERVLHGTTVLKVSVVAEIGIHRNNCRLATDVRQYCFTKVCDPCEDVLHANLLDDERWAAHITLLHCLANENEDVKGRIEAPASRLRRKNARQPIFFFNSHDDWVKVLAVETSREVVW